MQPTNSSPLAFEPALLRVAEAARLLNISRNTLYELVNRGEIPCLRVSKSIRLSRQSLTEWVKEREGNGAATAERIVRIAPKHRDVTAGRKSRRGANR